MYAFAQKITPDDERAIAAQLYVELLKGGYTSVVEFHYLHHQPDGTPYDEHAAMSLALHEAALEAGIALTLLPVVYMQAGVDGSPLAGAQRRFALDPDGWARLAGELEPDLRRRAEPPARPGAALGPGGSARRRSPPPWRQRGRSRGITPIHIHLAEQPKEVRDCLDQLRSSAAGCCSTPPSDRPELVPGPRDPPDRCRARRWWPSGRRSSGCARRPRPISATASSRWRRIWRRAACYGIGSDSNIATEAAAELRLLEQGQRLAHLRRVAAATAATAALRAAPCGPARSGAAPGPPAGRCGRLAPGFRADLVVLDPDHPSLFGRSGDLAAGFAPSSHQARRSAT